jgi:hypothetical protein
MLILVREEDIKHLSAPALLEEQIDDLLAHTDDALDDFLEFLGSPNLFNEKIGEDSWFMN